MVAIDQVASEADIAEVAYLAHEIWTAHYVPIIGRAQVDYMLARFQSEAAIRDQIADGQAYYLARDDGVAVGYLGLVPEPSRSRLMISKIYVDGGRRGSGVGRQMLAFTEALARQRGLASLWLTVNKHNRDSIRWYERMGFQRTGSLVQDIGGGFVMDDYRLEKPIS